MSVLKSSALFVAAAIAEIGGAWLVWQGVREHRGLIWVGAGIAALAAYGFMATMQDDAHFGRILAAYGGIFVAGSLACVCTVRRRSPLRTPSMERLREAAQGGATAAGVSHRGRLTLLPRG